MNYDIEKSIFGTLRQFLALWDYFEKKIVVVCRRARPPRGGVGNEDPYVLGQAVASESQ